MATINDEPVRFDLKIYQGKTYQRKLHLIAKGVTDIVANRENLTGVVYQSQIMSDYKDCGGVTIMDLSSCFTYDSVNREVIFRIEADDTEDLDFETAVWELNFIYTDGTVRAIAIGNASLYLQAYKVVV